MAVSLDELRSQLARREEFVRAPIMLVYGVEGVGKSTFAANAPLPIFIPAEDGFGNLSERIGVSIEAFPKPETYAQLYHYLNMIAMAPPHFKTLVIDTVDRVQKLIWDDVTARHGVETIQNISWGKGFVEVNRMWEDYLSALQWINKNKDMMIIQLVHTEVKAVNLPDSIAYDQYIMTLHKGAAALFRGQSDCIFFASYRPPHIATDKSGFVETRKAVGIQDRLLSLENKPTSFGKNRYSLPKEITLDGNTWEVIAQHVEWFKQFTPQNQAPSLAYPPQPILTA